MNSNPTSYTQHFTTTQPQQQSVFFSFVSQQQQQQQQQQQPQSQPQSQYHCPQQQLLPPPQQQSSQVVVDSDEEDGHRFCSGCHKKKFKQGHSLVCKKIKDCDGSCAWPNCPTKLQKKKEIREEKSKEIAEKKSEEQKKKELVDKLKNRSQLKSNSNLSGLVNGQLAVSEFQTTFLEKVGPVLEKHNAQAKRIIRVCEEEPGDEKKDEDDEEEETYAPPPKKQKFDDDVVSINSDLSMLENAALDFSDFRESDVMKEIANLSVEIHEIKEIVGNTQQSVKAVAALLKALVQKICNNK